MRRELNVFLSAVMFFTRVPVRLSIQYDDALLSQSTKYLPLIGIFVGAVGAGVFWGANIVLPVSVSMLLSMIATILLTGAFHEDGFADACDGFGGGWTKERILEIMKDSRIGAYGMIGMALLLFTKFTALTEIPKHIIPVALITGHVVSRWAATWFVFTHTYSRTGEQSKSQSLAKTLTWGNFAFATIISASSLAILPPFLALATLSAIPAKIIFARYVTKWINGYTGDVLGATQQICEVVFYISILILVNYM